MNTTKNLSHPAPSYLTGFLSMASQSPPEYLSLGDFLTLGRDSNNLLCLSDEWISSRHARIERKASGYVIQDMRSRNGTYVNGVRVNEAILKHNDRIRLGQTDLLFTTHRGLDEDKLVLESKNLAWRAELRRLPLIAASAHPVLLLGPSGSGKEVLAQLIHKNSPRHRGPFISVNCSALSESLVESELFGHLKGSFTGALFDRKGAFEAARGGTLFLDEIGDLPLTLQPKILRALENSEIRPLGSDHTVRTDIRLIAATHQDLRRRVSQMEFREDLYFRLNVLRLSPPALIERLEDFDSFLYTFCREQRISFEFKAIERLKEHSWPGNVRELRNLICRAKAYYPDQQITADLVEELIDHKPPGDLEAPKTVRPSIVKELEKQLIIQRLVANKGNQRRTAVDLGMPRSTLNDRIRRYAIDVHQLMEA